MSDVEIKLKLDKILQSENVAELMSKEQLRSISKCIIEGIDSDLESRKSWEESVDEWTKLAAQVREAKSFPWDNASNVKYPVLTIAATQFAARAYSALLAGPDYVQGRVVGRDVTGAKREKAIKIGKHMSYQLKEEMVEWENDMDRLLHVLPITGVCFKKTYFNPTLQRNVSEFVHPKELIVNYHAKSLEDAYRKTHVLYYTHNELISMVRSGVYLDVLDKIQKPKSETKKVSPDDTQKLHKPASDIGSTHQLYECHTWYDFDGDDYEEPYIITLHKETGLILRIMPCIDPSTEVKYGKKNKVSLIKQRQYFTSFIFIPDPNSSVYGLGFGSLLGPMNESINTLINQLIDAGTLGVLSGGFISSNLAHGLEGGDLEFQPGEWKIVNSYGHDINQGIAQLPIREPSSVLFNLLSMLENSAMKMASVVDVLTGEIPGQNTKATVMMAAIEQGLKVFSSIYKRCHRSLREEYKKLYLLNALYLEPDTYLSIFDEPAPQGQEPATQETPNMPQQVTQPTVGPTDYQIGDNDVVPYSDPNVSSEQQRLLKVQALGELLALGTINPTEYTKRFLEATDQPNIEALMTMPPPPGPPWEQVLAEKEFEHKQKMDIAKVKLEAVKIEQKDRQIDIDGILKMAQAEAAEAGSQFDQYERMVKLIMQAENDRIDRALEAVSLALEEKQAAQQPKQ